MKNIIQMRSLILSVSIIISGINSTGQIKPDSSYDSAGNEIKLSGESKGIDLDIVDESNREVFPSMHVEPDGTAHLVYVKNNTLMYAKRTRQTDWTYKSLGTCVKCNQNDVVMDKNGNLQIVVQDYLETVNPTGRLFQFTVTPAGTFTKKLVHYSYRFCDLLGFHSMSLKVDSQNELHLVFQARPGPASGGPMMEMHTSGGNWTEPVIFSTRYAYDHVDMEVDANDNLQISYYGTDIGFGYMKKSAGGTWNEPEAPDPGWFGAQLEGMVTSIITDDDLNPHISYVGQVNHDNRENIKYAWKKDGKWNISMVDRGGQHSAGNDIVLDQAGNAHIAYAHLEKYQIRYATNKSGTWIKQIVDPGFVPLWAHTIDMGIDQDNFIHIVYPSGSNPSRVGYALISPFDYFTVDPDTLDFRGVMPGGEETIALQLKNLMSQSFTIDSITVDDSRLSTDRNSFILGGNSTETVNVTLHHTNAPWTDNLLSIWYNGLFTDVPVLATSWQPVLTVDPAWVRFPDVPLNTTATMKVKLTNTGTLDLLISKIEEYKVQGSFIPDYFSLVGHNCTTIHPGEFCEVDVSFNPGKTGDQYSFLHIYSNDPVTPYKKVNLLGKAAFPWISTDKSEINFGYCPVGQSVTRSVTVKNVGKLQLNITSVSITGTDTDQFNFVNPCTTLQPDETCVIQITMSPTRLADLTANLTIISNSQYNSTYNISLRGSSLVKNLEILPALTNFGEVSTGARLSKQVELRNTGSGNIVISDIVASGMNQEEFSPEHNCTVINQGSSCMVTVWFTPLFPGSKTASLVVTSDDTYEPSQSVTLQGTGGSPLPLEVKITADPGVGLVPLDVQFQAQITGGQPPYAYLWNFNDQTMSDETSPIHTFTGSKLYMVTLQLEDLYGTKATANTSVIVLTSDIPYVTASASPVTGIIPLSVQFDATIKWGNQPFTYLWEFRDGSTSSQINPLHVYSSPGNYWARITVTDNDGDKSRDSVMITVQTPNSISGQFWNETGAIPVNKSTAVLYPQSDISNSTSLVLNGTNSYLFANLSVVNYTVRALPDAVEYPDLLPTYLGNKLAMVEATWVQASGAVTGKDISLIKRPPANSGSYLISGNMIIDYNGKGMTVEEKSGDVKGEPAAGALVYLKGSSDGIMKAYDITDSGGSFEFTSLPTGSYTFVADCRGKPMDASNTPLAVSDSRKEIEILATVGTDKITVKDVATGIYDAFRDAIKVFPVPAKDNITILIPHGMFHGRSVQLRIIDLSGRTILTDNEYELSGNPVTVDLSSLVEGLYLLEISDNITNQRIKIIKLQ